MNGGFGNTSDKVSVVESRIVKIGRIIYVRKHLQMVTLTGLLDHCMWFAMGRNYNLLNICPHLLFQDTRQEVADL